MPKVKSAIEKRTNRFSISISDEYEQKLKKLSTSCQMTKSEMTDTLLRICLDSTELIDKLQERYNRDEQYRIIPVSVGKKIYY